MGGAERSMAIQIAQFLSQHKGQVLCDLYIPKFIWGDSLQQHDLELHLRSMGFSIKGLFFPKTIYQFSRKGSSLFLGLWDFIKLPFELIRAFVNWKELKSCDLVYCNGNKVAILAIFFLFIYRYKGQIIWHWRDYPPTLSPLSFLVSTFFQCLSPFCCYSLSFVANSNSVAQALKERGVLSPLDVVYNPIGDLNLKNKDKAIEEKKIKKIAVVSMFAPWKGIHQILLWWGLYSEKLKEKGVLQLQIYGDQIYKTQGAHSCYKDQIIKLSQKLSLKDVHFLGNCSPSKIFSEVDLLIHPVIEKEPFGRVLIEAMAAKIPVVTTALGGACELAHDFSNCRIFRSYEYEELTAIIEDLIVNQDKQKEQVKQGQLFATKIDKMACEQFNQMILKRLNIKESNIEKEQAA